MTEKTKQTQLFNRILIISGISAAALFFGYVIFTKRPNMKYYVPQDFEGWVTIRFEVPEAPPLNKVDGEYEIYIPDSGIVETSSRLKYGWGRQEYYFWDGQNTVDAEFVKKWEKREGETERRGHIHSLHEQHIDTMDVIQVIKEVPDLEDTLLWDGTTITKRGEQMDVQTGRDLFQHFYVSKNRQPFEFSHPEVPAARRRRDFQ